MKPIRIVFPKRFCSDKCRLIAWALKEANKGMKKSLIVIGLLMVGSQSLIAQPDFNVIVDAIYKAEGGKTAKKPFGILSVPCSGYESCRKICFNTVRNNYRRWNNAGNPGQFLSFLASRYAPIGAGNDPAGLNHNWLKNVTYWVNHG